MKKRANACLQRQRHKRTRHLVRRQAKRRVTGAAKSRGQMVVCELLKTIEHFFPDLLERLRELEDCRRKSDYALRSCFKNPKLSEPSQEHVNH